MSSIVGHIAAGTCVYLAHRNMADRASRFALPLMVFAAIGPDVDYIALWLFGLDFRPRITHSLAFCALLGVSAWLIGAGTRRTDARKISFTVFFAASTSHLVLDLLVSVHPLPLLWPFTSTGFVLPVGVLPSAGKLQFSNYYLWRNLFIEAGVLAPVFAAIVAWRHGVPIVLLARRAVPVAPIWLGFLFWSISLSR